MPANIIEAIQQSLVLPELKKIDPVSQEREKTGKTNTLSLLTQGAVAGVVAGLYKYTEEDEHCNFILAGGNGDTNWLATFFKDKIQEAITKVALYSNTTEEMAGEVMSEVAQEAVLIIHQTMDNKHTAQKLREYMRGQRHNILVYLPPVMKFGYLLEDNSFDDQTNKMEGPISTMMHKIENMLSHNDQPKYP